MRWQTRLPADIAHTLSPPLSIVVVGQKPGHLLCAPGSVEWSTKVRARPCHPPAPSPASGLLDSVLTPRVGALNKTESPESQRQYELNEIKHAVTVLLDFAETLLEKPPEERMETLTNVTRFLLTQRPDDFF
nr:unnamed protein product [Spirometra erinaceieuropaei]